MNTNHIFNKILSSYDKFYYKEDNILLVGGDALKNIKLIPDNSISLILTDPPYHSTKKNNIIGDKDFDNDNDYINWIEQFAIEWKRVLKFNGSIFCFCSSAMMAKLQIMFEKYFNILSEIVWTKPNDKGYDGWKQKAKKENLRQWYPHSERILFMEYSHKGNLFNSYFGSCLLNWRKQVKMTMKDLAELTGSYGKVNHGGAIANWEAGRNIPSKEQYNKIVEVLTKAGIKNMPCYEDIIRPFNVSKDVEFTDVWTFENVRQYRGKHPAEKPQNLLMHAIQSTTYADDIVLDCFSGSGATGLACKSINRKCILFEIDKHWCQYATNKLNVLKLV